MNYIVIGTGPVGVVVAEYLLSQNKQVVIIDNSQCLNENTRDFTLKKSDRNIFSGNIYSQDKKTKHLPVSSSAQGGFSEIWGGTFSELDDRDFRDWDISREDLFKYYEYLINLLNLDVNINNNFKLMSVFDESDEIFSELFKKSFNKNVEIQKSKIMKKGSDIWSAKSLLKEVFIKYPNLKYINNFEVTNITENNDKIILHSNNQTLKYDNSKVLVCAGVLSSSLIASNILKNYKFSIQTSDLKVLPIIYFGKSVKSGKNTFPQAFINFLDRNIKTQLYAVNKNLTASIGSNQSRISSILLKTISKFLNSRLLLLFIYSNSEQSSYFNFLNDKNKVYLENKVKKNDSSLSYVFFNMLKQTLKLKLLPIPFFKKFPTYGSFHNGSTKFLENKKYLYKFDELGKVQNDLNVYFLDSSVFYSVPSGPTTFLSMSYALYKTEKILDEE